MLNNKIADEVWLTGGVANLAIHLSGHDIGEGNVTFLKNELKDAWEPTVDATKSLLSTYADNIVLPVDVAANVEGNRIDLKVEKLPIHAPLFDLWFTIHTRPFFSNKTSRNDYSQRSCRRV